MARVLSDTAGPAIFSCSRLRCVIEKINIKRRWVNLTINAQMDLRLNDRCRQGFDRTAKIVMTRTCLGALSNGTLASEAVAQAHVLQALRRYTFPADCPERDRGQFELSGETIHFRIDYYDVALEWGSEDPADASITRRVLTLMLREDL